MGKEKNERKEEEEERTRRKDPFFYLNDVESGKTREGGRKGEAWKVKLLFEAPKHVPSF